MMVRGSLAIDRTKGTNQLSFVFYRKTSVYLEESTLALSLMVPYEEIDFIATYLEC